jgi:hypothetical protein
LRRGRPASHEPYSKLKNLLNEMGPELRREPAPALRQLAEITDFALYVSTTPSIGCCTIPWPRAAPARTTKTSDVSSGRRAAGPRDLPCEPRALRRCTVVQILGGVSREREYALSDEDTL